MEHLGVPNSPPTQRGRQNSRNHEQPRRRWSWDRGSSHSLQDGLIHDHWHTDKPNEHYGPKRRNHHRPQSPGLKWHKKYTERSQKNGRVLVIDYVRQDLSKAGTRKVSAQEISDIGGLRRLYTSQRRDEAVLRVFHVQNADWAVQFLFKKFNIVKRDDLVDSDFGKWFFWKHPNRGRGRAPLLSGRAWPTQHDPWRGISKTSFGVDYLKSYRTKDPSNQVETDPVGKWTELNCYDESTEVPRYGFDVYGQRTGVYIQRKEEHPPPTFDGLHNPYEDSDGQKQRSEEYFPVLDTLDNGNAILIFEGSKSGSIQDTLINARGKWEQRWRRLPFYVAYDHSLPNDDEEMAVLCARTILSDIWRAVADSWQSFLHKSRAHVEILEARMYERPADESRADEIWKDTSTWLRCERLAYFHQGLIEEISDYLKDLSDDPGPEESWLAPNVNDFRRINNLIQEDLVKPTSNLSDLLYKSIGIRDSRHSLELSYSSNLVSFVFLPLTFVSGFFGMNVDIFSSDPPLRWFFIVSAPMMAMVFCGWFLLKSALTASNNDPYSRGVYERLYHDLAVQYPALWTRSGPASGTPKLSQWQRCKWALIQYWNDPNKTIQAKKEQSYAENDHFDGLGAWSRFSRLLTRQWTAEINAAMTMHREIEQGGPATDHPVKEGIEVVQQALNLSVPGAAQHAEVLHLPNGVGEKRYSIPGNEKAHAAAALAAAATSPSPPSVPSDFDHRVTNLQRIGSPPSSGRPSSAGGVSHNSGVLIEERPPDAEEADEEGSQEAERRRSSAGEEQHSPDVPVIRGEDDLPLN